MNIRISAIATSVMLVTVMPRNSRSILFSIGKPRSGRNRSGGALYTENGTQYPGQVYSEVNTPLTIDASGIYRADISQAETARRKETRSRGGPSIQHGFCLPIPDPNSKRRLLKRRDSGEKELTPMVPARRGDVRAYPMLSNYRADRKATSSVAVEISDIR